MPEELDQKVNAAIRKLASTNHQSELVDTLLNINQKGFITEQDLQHFNSGGIPLVSAIASRYPIPLSEVINSVNHQMITSRMVRNVLSDLA